MVILVISDTHRRINKAADVIMSHGEITNVIHLGDMVRDAEELSRLFPHISFHKVMGNNDIFSDARQELILNLCGHNIFASHGHKYGVKSDYTTLAHHAKMLGCDIAFFGHTHIYTDETINGVRCLNPSSNGYFLVTNEEISFYKY